ncbi:hypothetical protein KUV62_15705 [Salipiger bermudensis]|uniref:hypothetical protein n=1 Tax=Salipiger bermudensis TaxID=344736 RepID=UPI001C998F08|nr:hypothetical protein [Salipiger bermudensis]MBY6005370.1 hypothetical protein [Salipiger bermudensis]
MFNTVPSGSGFNVLSIAAPIAAKRQEEFRNRLANMGTQQGAGNTQARNNALATYGGPTRAAAASYGGNDVAAGIIDTASALGVDPIDLATAISYETAGTFDPTKAGPTTQWGQHRGLIQFGEPQAEQYGVDWDNPVGSQLGADGAVARYLRENGVTPGMGLLDIYSTINAGAPGLYNRSDANNGGAPGTVRDKVESQMAGHRRNAERLLGSSSDQSFDALAYLGL